METNAITITNYVFMVSTGAVPVCVVNTNSVPVSVLGSCDQVSLFLNGFSYGFPMALTLAVVWVIYKGLTAGSYPGSN